MNYYPHHIGDFIRDTANLTDVQLSAYLRMMWAYYLSEQPFTDAPEDIAFAVRSDEKTVQLLLKHYFHQVDGAWHHKRIDKEIADFKAKGEKRRSAANARWSAVHLDANASANAENGPDACLKNKQKHANALQVQSNSKKNHANQEPITNNQNINTTASPDGFTEFYSKYPKKVGRPAAEKAFRSAKAGQHLEAILSDIDLRLANGDWTLEKRQFIPNPATYLNQRRWEDAANEAPAVNPMFAGMLNARA